MTATTRALRPHLDSEDIDFRVTSESFVEATELAGLPSPNEGNLRVAILFERNASITQTSELSGV